MRRLSSQKGATDAHAQTIDGDERGARKDISALYMSGLSGAKIAKMVGVSRSTIYRRLTAQRVQRRRPGARDLRLDPEAVIALVARGVNLTDVAARLGCHRATVFRLLRAHGVR